MLRTDTWLVWARLSPSIILISSLDTFCRFLFALLSKVMLMFPSFSTLEFSFEWKWLSSNYDPTLNRNVLGFGRYPAFRKTHFRTIRAFPLLFEAFGQIIQRNGLLWILAFMCHAQIVDQLLGEVVGTFAHEGHVVAVQFGNGREVVRVHPWYGLAARGSFFQSAVAVQ